MERGEGVERVSGEKGSKTVWSYQHWVVGLLLLLLLNLSLFFQLGQSLCLQSIHNLIISLSHTHTRCVGGWPGTSSWLHALVHSLSSQDLSTQQQ